MASIFLNLGMFFDYDGADEIIVRDEQIIPKTHEYLFHFLEADLTRLEAYTRSYLVCIDKQNPEQSTQGDSLVLHRIFEELFAVHPYFRSCPAGASAVVNSVFAGYVNNIFPNDTEIQLRILERICTEKYLGVKNVEHWMENPSPVSDECLFTELSDLQKNISSWVFLTLDNTNPNLAKLTNQQRNVIYSLLFGGEYLPILETRIEKFILRPRSLGSLSAELDFDEDFMLEAHNGISDMQKDPSAPVPDSVNRIISAAEHITDDCERHIYIIDTLEDVLKYEVYGIIQNEIRVKRCKYCNRYFVLEKGNMEYCDRIAPGETKPCNDIGKSRTYEQRITGGKSAMSIYRKAYKTHFARTRSGNMTKDEFDLWKAEAANKRELVESGELEFDEYAIWLKK